MIPAQVSVLLFVLLALAHASTFNEKNNITRTNPDFPFDGEMFTGFIVIDNATRANIFYHIYAYNQTNLSTPAPLIIWLEGGPGCSSEYGNFVDFGPVSVLNGTDPNTYSFKKNAYTWNRYGHLLYIDNPTGTGFSRANGLNVSSTAQASQHFQIFLARFYQLYPDLVSYPLYLVGESFAGHYIPVFTHDLLQNETFTSQVKIEGIAIGGSWSDPLRQTPTYGTFGYASGLIDARSRDQLRMQEAQGVADILAGDYYDATPISFGLIGELATLGGNVSHYNYREFDTSDDDFYINWLNTTQTQDFLNIPYEPYTDCNDDIFYNFFGDVTKSVADLYPDLISKLPVLLYGGQDDETVDYEGLVRYINALDWVDIQNFRNAKRVPWKLTNGTTAGLVKAYGNFTFLLVLKAGHLVPSDQPEAASEMIYNFINKIPFN